MRELRVRVPRAELSSCNSNFWIEDSDIRVDLLTLDPMSSTRVEGTIAISGDLGEATPDFCSLLVRTSYEPVESLPLALRVQEASQPPDVLATTDAFRFDQSLVEPFGFEPALENVDENSCSFSLAFINDSQETIDLAVAFVGRFGGPDNYRRGRDFPPAPLVVVEYETAVE
ncbi:MAG: hypothetical protein AAFY60_12880 [Myxococcota bacterium]